MTRHSVESIVQSLETAGVRYLIVGGLAVVAQGHLRFTADVDLVLAPGIAALSLAEKLAPGWKRRTTACDGFRRSRGPRSRMATAATPSPEQEKGRGTRAHPRWSRCTGQSAWGGVCATAAIGIGRSAHAD